MESKWRKLKSALPCLYPVEDSSRSNRMDNRLPDAVSLSSTDESSVTTMQTPLSVRLLSSRFGSRSSKKTCAICLTSMKAGKGHAIFTAECSHSFHFHCIASNVKHGNRICPICRSNWNEVPFQTTTDTDLLHNNRTARANNAAGPRNAPWNAAFRQTLPSRLDVNLHATSFFHAPEPNVFDDDDELISEEPLNNTSVDENQPVRAIDIKAHPEISSVSRLASHKDFTILIHLKALISMHNSSNFSSTAVSNRAPIDLVAVLDVSGSMSGGKLVLLKRAMGFLIQRLGSSDRLSIVAFSSTARRSFPLRRMTNNGKHDALQAVSNLVSAGGTNIGEGLKKGAKVMVERRQKNPVSSMILLSDGKNMSTTDPMVDYHSLLPESIMNDTRSGIVIPVHTFGFGADHDAALMHFVSVASGGTFSFIETENAIQDAFAQCIGGLLTVIIQELQVKVETLHPNLQLNSIKAGNYRTRKTDNASIGYIDFDHLYAEEERDFLVKVDIPVYHDSCNNDMQLLKIGYSYTDPITKEKVTLEDAGVLKISRPEIVSGDVVVSVEVNRQINRIRAAEAIAEARAMADESRFIQAASILESCCNLIMRSMSAQAGDQLSAALCAEMKEMQGRMVDYDSYTTGGRAYVLSGLSSHSWQRATTSGNTTVSQAYQTPTMVDMVSMSQTMLLDGSSSQQPLLRPSRSLTLPIQR
ncbi:E3 ubiquitin-protein ligase WAV3-like [Impatiens glandulifera]|uniref:E3 ubiquitin-protein ligase WAV3-like n=1 Tax=Impatiens glandulifera TaxID=253017 RepID=UPI001FB0894D|nr:E3 ubiquitin-protein ligase WAV3-like [Impatiens glandulifera]